MRLFVAGALLCGVVVQAIQIVAPQQCTDSYQRSNCAQQGAHCLACSFDSGTQPFCVGSITRAGATQYCNQRDPNGSGGNVGLGGLGGLGNLGIGNDLGGLGNLGINNGYNSGVSNGECNFGSYCSNGPCVVCNIGNGQRSLCADQSNPSRDFCNSPQFQGLCTCPGGELATPQVAVDQSVQTNPVDNSIQISYVEPLVPLQDFQSEPINSDPADATASDPSQELPDYAAFMVPRGLTRDHIRGETSK